MLLLPLRYGLSQLSELLSKMLASERGSSDDMPVGSVPPISTPIRTALWKTEFECPICFEEMKPPMRIWQCMDGHAICAGCRSKTVNT